MKTIYFISGLGADKRVFNFLDLNFCKPVFVHWIKPIAHETLESYAHRLSAIIKEPNAAIVGLSFGGMLATEIAKANPNYNVIIIASNKKHSEFPHWLRIGKYIPIYRWSSEKFSKKLNKITSWILGANGKQQKETLHQIIQESDYAFTMWAIEAIMHWQNEIVPTNLTHIHGTADKLLPYRYVQADYTIDKGEHLMVMDKTDEITALIQKLI